MAELRLGVQGAIFQPFIAAPRRWKSYATLPRVLEKPEADRADATNARGGSATYRSGGKPSEVDTRNRSPGIARFRLAGNLSRADCFREATDVVDDRNDARDGARRRGKKRERERRWWNSRRSRKWEESGGDTTEIKKKEKKKEKVRLERASVRRGWWMGSWDEMVRKSKAKLLEKIFLPSMVFIELLCLQVITRSSWYSIW